MDGDENSRFFHGSLKHKNRKNKIRGLNINGDWISNPKAIKEEIHKFFASKFSEQWPCRPKLINPNFKQLSLSQANYLEAEFTSQEIKTAIWSCGGEKAPGPDGFTFKLLKDKWDIIKEDVIKFVKHFEASGTLAPGCNSSFITLIPKTPDLLSLSDYRPIVSLAACTKWWPTYLQPD